MDILHEMLAFVNLSGEDEDIEHYGTKRHSGRYPWGSGETPYQHSNDWLSRVEELRKAGYSYTDEDGKTWHGDTAIAKSFGLSTTEFRTAYDVANTSRRADERATALSMREHGATLQEITDKLGYKNDSSIRNLLRDDIAERKNKSRVVYDILKKQVEEKGMIDVGAYTELQLGVSKEKLNAAIYMLQAEDGYLVYGGGVPQVTNPGQQTNLRVLCPPGTEHKDIYDFTNIHQIDDIISYDGGETFVPSFLPPTSLDSKRLDISYAEDGGTKKDGLIEIRPGVKDLDLGTSHYAQVRIAVDGEHYLKGMAAYATDLPDGIDIRFNTNKKRGTELKDVLKPLKRDSSGNIDWENPFGALIKERGGQSFYDDPDGEFINPDTGNKAKLSLINKTREEGDWREWSQGLPSQMLGKQNKELISRQLDLAKQDKKIEYEDICSLTNPTVKRYFLEKFASDCDSSAADLHAASFPGQKWSVILPMTTIKDDEIYAPNYADGTKLALIRYPHGGIFEIPIVTVNNKYEEGKRLIGPNAKDAVGISAATATQLSGADFDGDTAMCIPTGKNGVDISYMKPLKELQEFDTKQYKLKESKNKKGETIWVNAEGRPCKTIVKGSSHEQNEMGKVSNLITDMTLKGAPLEEIVMATKHSMVVIDAGKHHLDYKQSEKDNHILELKDKWQGRYDEDGNWRTGASTLLSRASASVDIPKRKGQAKIDTETGELIFKDSGESYIDPKTGKEKIRTQKSNQMNETKDARTLSSGTLKEELYADYANGMKAMANDARKTLISTPRLKYDPKARETYKAEVESLDGKLRLAQLNSPKERQAQMLANTTVKAKIADNPILKEDKKTLKKVKQKALVSAREKVGAHRVSIDISDKEWEAIQKGAITDTKLTAILKYSDMDRVRELSMPRQNTELSQAKQNKIATMKRSGYSNAEIAEAVGVSTSTITKYT